MNICFVFIRVKDGFTNNVLSELNQLPGVQEAYSVWTPLHFDIIAMLKADNLDTITEILVPKIREINGVDSTDIAIPHKQP